VDFLSKVISKAHQIRERGSSEDVAYLRARTRELIGFNAGLRRRARQLSRSNNAANSTANTMPVEPSPIAIIEQVRMQPWNPKKP